MSKIGKKPFDVEALVAHVKKVKADTPSGTAPDYGAVFSYSTDAAGRPVSRSSGNCLWINVFATDIHGYKDAFAFRFKATQSSGVDPATAEGVAEANKWRGENNIALLTKPRDRPPSVSITKYTATPKLDDDKITPVRDAAGNMLNADTNEPLTEKDISDVGMLMEAFNIWFALTMRRWFRTDKFFRGNDSMMDDGDVDQSAKVVPSTKPCPVMQTHISSQQGGANAGKPLPNPICRFNIKVAIGNKSDNSGTVTEATILDGRKPAGGAFEPLVDDGGVPFNHFNAHKLLTRGSELFGVADCSSICFSNFGISVPSSVKVLVVKPYTGMVSNQSAAELLGLAHSAAPAAPVAAPAAAPTPAAAPAAATAAAAPAAAQEQMSVDDVDALLSSL